MKQGPCSGSCFRAGCNIVMDDIVICFSQIYLYILPVGGYPFRVYVNPPAISQSYITCAALAVRRLIGVRFSGLRMNSRGFQSRALCGSSEPQMKQEPCSGSCLRVGFVVTDIGNIVIRFEEVLPTIRSPFPHYESRFKLALALKNYGSISSLYTMIRLRPVFLA